MYRLKFNNTPERYLYMFKVQENTIISDSGIYTWEDVTGTNQPLKLRFDEVDENGLFTPVVKTSLEVLLIRRTATQFNDIIEADDNDWMAVVTEGGTLVFDSTHQLSLSSSSTKCIFKGLLTLETYGEAYQQLANVKLTFHDRLGELADLDFEPSYNYMTLTGILAKCLHTIPESKRLFLEFPFDVETDEWQNLESPRHCLLDVSEYKEAKKYDVLKDFMESFGFVLYVDSIPVVDGSLLLSDYGAIRVECIADKIKANAEYFVFTLQSIATTSSSGAAETVLYDYVNAEDSSGGNEGVIFEEREIIEIDIPATCPILRLSGGWQQVRKAKYIEGLVNFNLKDSILFPVEFDIDDFEACQETGYSLQYPYWRKILYDYFGYDLYSIFNNPYIYEKAWANLVSSTKVPGLFIKDNPNTIGAIFPFPVLMIKSAEVTSLNILYELYTTKPYVADPLDSARITFNLLIQYNGTIYQWANGNWEATEVILDYFLVRPTPNALFSGELPSGSDAIELPDFIQAGENFLMTILVREIDDYYDSDEYTYLTSLKIQLDTDTLIYPKKIKEITLLSDTRRHPIKFESKFYNLPEIAGNTALYDNGIYATALDRYDSTGKIEDNSNLIIAPPTLKYRGNNATLLVHLSDMVGYQHLSDRWKFDATIKKVAENIESEVIPDLMTKLYSAVTDSSIVDVGGEWIIGWNQVSEYGVEWRKITDNSDDSSGEFEWHVQQAGTILYKDNFTCSIEGLDGSSEYEYRAYIITNSVIYYGQIESVTTEASPTYNLFITLTWTDVNQGETDGMAGAVYIRNAANEIIETYSITTYSKSEYWLYDYELVEGGVWVDFSGVEAWVGGISVTKEIRWQDNEGVWNYTEQTELFTTGDHNINVEDKSST